MKQWTGSKLGKMYIKAVCCHFAYLTYMQRASCEMLDWIKHKLESSFPGEISVNHPYGRKRRTKETFDNGKRGEWKSWLKTQHSENEDHGIWSHHFMVNRWVKKMPTVMDVNFLGSKITADVTVAMKLKDTCFL